MNRNKPNTATEWVDPDDAPELTDAFFEEADEYMGNQLVRRGRPVSGEPLRPTAAPPDADPTTACRFSGEGWRSRMDDALRDWLKSHPPA